jgi:hypothetical protein
MRVRSKMSSMIEHLFDHCRSNVSAQVAIGTLLLTVIGARHLTTLTTRQ